MIKDFFILTKPSITAMSVLMCAGGMWLTQQPLSPALMMFTLLGTALAVGSANALNMYLERDVDQHMQRTQGRPLPQGRISPSTALIFGLSLGLAALYVLWSEVNLLTTALAIAALAVYAWVYTPLKLKTPWALWIGAIPGATPPLLGWTAVTGAVDFPGVVLFSILLLWQIPHFIAISIYRKQDYAQAGIRTVTWVHGESAAKTQAVVFATAILPISWLLMAGDQAGIMTHWLYTLIATFSGLMYMGVALQGCRLPSEKWARKLFLSSLLYLPLLSLGLFLDIYFL